MADLPHLTEPGQAGTLLGAVVELLAATPDDGCQPALGRRSALRWWKGARIAIAKSPACDRTNANRSCPSCQDGEPCPRHIIGSRIHEYATVNTAGQMTDARVRALLGTQDRAPLTTWRTHHEDALAYALWRVATYLLQDGQDERALTAVDQGIAMDLHTREPRFALLACDRLVEIGRVHDAFHHARRLLDERDTDPAYDDLADWVLFTENAIYAQTPTPRKPITNPRLARPEGHSNPRLYS